MLSRFSALFVYLIAGLAVSAVATPMMGQPSGHGDGTKQPSKHNYAQERPYSHQESNSSKNCNVGEQHCCNQVNKASEKEAGDIASLFGFTQAFDSDLLVGKQCTPFFGIGGKCEAHTVCCENSKFEGLIAIGCTNLNLIL